MDPSSTANRHDMLGPGVHCTPTTDQTREWDIENSHTLTTEPAPRQKIDEDDHVAYSSSRGAAGTASHNRARRGDTAAATEIGALDSRIPTDQDVRDQLAAARDSQLPVGPSRTAGTHPPPATSGRQAPPHTLLSREHRNSNYAPGYEEASNAVPQKTYSETGHSPMALPHEGLISVEGGTTQTRDFSYAPPLPPRASAQQAESTAGDASRRDTSGSESLGRKLQGVFAQAHVRTFKQNPLLSSLKSQVGYLLTSNARRPGESMTCFEAMSTRPWTIWLMTGRGRQRMRGLYEEDRGSLRVGTLKRILIHRASVNTRRAAGVCFSSPKATTLESCRNCPNKFAYRISERP